MIVTELWEGRLDSAPMAHLLWERGEEALDRFGTTGILMDLPIGGNHGVVGCRGKLNTGTEKGDGALIAALQDRCGVRNEPGFPNSIGKRPSLLVKVAHGVVGSRDRLWLLPSVPRDDDAHVFIRAPRS